MASHNEFDAMKQQLLEENERLYGHEIRVLYGQESLEESNNLFREISEEQFQAAKALERQLMQLLTEAMEEGNPASDLAQEAVELHKRWLRFYWKQYTYEMHAGLAQMYTADERCISYYDQRIQQGATKFLHDAICIYVDRATNE